MGKESEVGVQSQVEMMEPEVEAQFVVLGMVKDRTVREEFQVETQVELEGVQM